MVQEKALREAWGEILVEMAQENPNIVVLDGDLANSTRADIFADACPDRFLEMGIAEQNMLGVAAGLSTMGYIPFISTFAAFAANRALDQIRVVIAQPRLNVKITGSYSGLLTGKTGKTHQDFSDLATFRSLPNMVVVSPADAVELRKALATMNVVSKTNQLPALRVGHGERTRDVDRMLAGTRLALTGNYFTGVAIEDCVIRSRQEWVRLQREIG